MIDLPWSVAQVSRFKPRVSQNNYFFLEYRKSSIMPPLKSAWKK